MKIAAVNGSPKLKGSLSGKIIEHMEKILGEHINVYHAAKLVRNETTSGSLRDLLSANALLIVFPLYVDSLPAPLIEFLTRLEKAKDSPTPLRVFAIVNCGFFEPKQIELAIEMIKHFTDCAGLQWGYGLGIGGGPLMAGFGNNWSSGPVSRINNALCDMAGAIRENRSGQDVFTVAKFPRIIYKTMVDMSWSLQARKSGMRAASLRARPYAVKDESRS